MLPQGKAASVPVEMVPTVIYLTVCINVIKAIDGSAAVDNRAVTGVKGSCHRARRAERSPHPHSRTQSDTISVFPII